MDKKIGIALSGGGVRATAFHAGVLRYLAEQKLLKQVTHISSVSGGSLFIGLVFRYANYRWPSDKIYFNKVLPYIRQTLTTKSLAYSWILNLFKPINWRHLLLSRANVLAKTIENLWGIKKPLSALPKTRVWSINCTTGETGHRYRFKNKKMGDSKLGYANVGNFYLSNAMAASAGFPFWIGPLTLHNSQFSWSTKNPSDTSQSISYQLPFKYLHLYDGGLYDNLGTEPLFDVGKKSLRKSAHISYLLISDGSIKSTSQALPLSLNPLRLKRIIDIIQDQCRALRVRVFINGFQENKIVGAYVGIGTEATSSIKKYKKGKEALARNLLQEDWLSEDDVKKAATYPTSLCKLSESTFDLLEQHGYETAKWNIEMMAKVAKKKKLIIVD